jgi:hypothetical protein
MFYKNRNNIFTKSAAVTLVSLLIANDIAWAQPASFTSPKQSTLAVPTELLDPEFREKFAVSRSLLSSEGVRHYINEQIEREKLILKDRWKIRRTEVIDDIATSKVRGRIVSGANSLKSAALVRVARFLNSTGQVAFVDLTGQINISEEFGGLPVVYIDSMLCNTPDNCIQRHEIDEILQWEDLRINVLHIADKKEMAKWVSSHINSPDDQLKGTSCEGLNTRQIAKLFCGYSYPVRDIYKKLNATTEFDNEYINTMLQLYGVDETSSSPNIAASPTDMTNDGRGILKKTRLRSSHQTGKNLFSNFPARRSNKIF